MTASRFNPFALQADANLLPKSAPENMSPGVPRIDNKPFNSGLAASATLAKTCAHSPKSASASQLNPSFATASDWKRSCSCDAVPFARYGRGVSVDVPLEGRSESPLAVLRLQGRRAPSRWSAGKNGTESETDRNGAQQRSDVSSCHPFLLACALVCPGTGGE